MKTVNVKQLQQEFGLPFTTAEALIREQEGLVRRRYRHWYMLIGGLLFITVACKFAPLDSLYYRIDDFVLLLACLGTGSLEILIQHKARPAILAAARAAAPTG